MARNSRTRSRATQALIVIVVATLFGAGWLAARHFESPAQQAADSRPPKAGVIYERVGIGGLQDRVSGSGTIGLATSTPIRLATLVANATVTKTHVHVGQTVRQFDVLLDLNGDPVFVVSGQFPFYRDLSPGMSGPDVTQLQNALASIGFRTANAQRGRFGADTVRALHTIYSRDGYRPRDGLALSAIAEVPRVPAVVTRIAPVGAQPPSGNAVASLASGDLVAKIAISASEFLRVHTGMSVSLTVAGSTAAVSGTVSALDESTRPFPTVSVTPASGVSLAMLNRPVIAIITIQSLARRALLLPTRAVATDSAGRNHVLRRDAGMQTTAVQVTDLGSLNGLSAVEPATPSTLKAGDFVVVGQ